MKKILLEIWDVVKQPENFILILTASIATVLIVLDIGGVTKVDKELEFMIFILDAIAISLMVNFHQQEKRARELRNALSKKCLYFRKELPDVVERLDRSKDVLLLGKGLIMVLRNVEIISSILNRGTKIRIALLNPFNNCLIRTYAKTTEVEAPKYLQDDVIVGFNLIKSILTKTQNPNLLEIRVLDYPPLFSIFKSETKDEKDNSIVVDLPIFRASPSRRVALYFEKKKDLFWYDFFSQMAEEMWEKATEIQVEQFMNQLVR